MSNIEILFQLPQHIEAGLALGKYERIGGVIRNSQSKQIVMWLQEGGQVATNPNATKGLMASVLQNTGMSSATMSVILGGTLSTLNVAMSGYTLYLMIERVRELEKAIDELHEKVSEEFARDRRIEFEAALSNARDVVDAENISYKQQAANQAINQLFKARQQRLTDFDELLNDTSDIDHLFRANHYLLQAMMASTLRIRCYLETNQETVARSRLKEALQEYYPRTRELVRKWLGAHPAMYFHSEVSEEDFSRFLKIEAWVRDEDNILPVLIKEYREDFWNREAIKPLTSSSFNFPFMNRNSRENEPIHLQALTQSEIVIENYQRLLGFELELASMRLSFNEWDSIVSNLEERDDYVLLVDQDIVDASSRLSS